MLLEARSISRSFLRGGAQVQALQGVSFDAEVGEFLAITGPSGSGKTTLLHVLGLLDPGFCGSLVLGGREVRRLSAGQLAALRLTEIGFVFQGFHLIAGLNVEDNVALPHWRRHGGKKAARARALTLLTDLGLAPRRKQRVNRLSAGEMQRVALARALINEPNLLLADEPTGNLDSASTRTVLGQLSALSKSGKTVIVITHDPEVVQVAQRVIHLRYGQLVAPPAGGL